ncbi:MAG: alpha-amylase family glycosyl hydrolase [Chloroflexota bacterium]
MKKTTLILAILAALLVFAPVAAQDERAALPWWNDRVFYELFVRSFYDSDGDGIGDLQGVIQKLDYLNDGDPATTDDLGVTGLWLMPIMESPSYHGYDVTDYRTVESDYGTNDDFKQLMTEAHKRGIAVIVDLVVNHTSSEHPWFVASAAQDPEYADWYRWDTECPTYRGPWGEQVWIRRGDRCYYAVFWEGMPDLNYANPAVMTEMSDIARYWVKDMGADGFRLDGLKHVVEEGTVQENTASTRAWAAEFHNAVLTAAPDSLTVGEVWSSDYLSSQYVPDGADLVFEFDLATAMLQSAQGGRSAAIASLQNRAFGLYPPNQYVAFLTNHDQNRVMSELRSVEKAKVAASLLLTQPGVPFIYYGEEIGMQGIKPDERIRTPMQWDDSERTAGFSTQRPWEPLQNDAETVNVVAESADPDSLLSHYRNLIRLRTEHPALTHGDFVPVASASREVYAFLRRSEEETVLVVLNLSDEAITDYGLSLEAGLSAGASVATSSDGTAVTMPELTADGGFAGYLPLAELAPYSVIVIPFSA